MTDKTPTPARDVGHLRLRTLQKRPEFLAAARGSKAVTPSMIVQARARRDGTSHIGIGYTCSKKVGNAVARNRAKRRLREAARALLPALGCPGTDYVLIGRATATAARDFGALQNDLATALANLKPKDQPQ